jgi:ABC-2 type transport system permease protein
VTVTTAPSTGTAPRRGSHVETFLRTCRAEWLRLWTVKATWWCLGAAASILIGLGTAIGATAEAGPDGPGGQSAWGLAESLIMPAQFAILTLALMAITADYATGGIVPTLQWTPRRSTLFAARTLVVAGTATVVTVLLSAVACVAAWTAARPLVTLAPEDALDPLGTVALVIAAGTLLAVGLGFVLRSTAGVLVSVFLLLLILPGLLPQLGFDWLTELSDWLPGTAAIFLLGEEPRGRGIDDASAVLTLLAWAGSALLLGWLRLVKDDASR